MLYHVTATHTPDNCPLYNPEIRATAVKAMQNSEAVAKEHNVRLLFSVSGAPDHVFYHLLETDSFQGVLNWLGANPIKQDFRITPVVSSIALTAWGEREWGTGR
jgi:hypothetical protein